MSERTWGFNSPLAHTTSSAVPLLALAAVVVVVAVLWGPPSIGLCSVLYLAQAAQPLLASRRLAHQRERWETAAVSNR